MAITKGQYWANRLKNMAECEQLIPFRRELLEMARWAEKVPDKKIPVDKHGIRRLGPNYEQELVA